jgi:hypothetical protein
MREPPPTVDGKTHLDLIKEGAFQLKKIPPKEDTPKPVRSQDGFMQFAMKSESNNSVSEEESDGWGFEAPGSTQTPEQIEAAETEATQKAQERKQQELEKAFNDAQQELATLSGQQAKDHVGETMDSVISGLTLPEGRTDNVHNGSFTKTIQDHFTAYKIVESVVPELLQKDQMIKFDKLKELLSKLQEIVKAGVTELKEKRAQLHDLQRQAAEAKVALAEAKLNGSEEVAAKQVAYEKLSQEMIALEKEVKVLQGNMVDYTYFAKGIVEPFKPAEGVVTKEELREKLGAIRKDAAGD